MLELIPGIAAESRPSWCSRHLVSDTHREPDRETDPAGFFRAVVLGAALTWAAIATVCVAVALLRRYG